LLRLRDNGILQPVDFAHLESLMHPRRIATRFPLGLAALLGLAFIWSSTGAGEKKKEVWTDPQDATLPRDFAIQGEYVGTIEGGGKLAAQVISLGKGAFQAVFLPGGLPGDGWDGMNKILLDGLLDGDQASFLPATGKRRYLAQSPLEFSATSKFPPVGQKTYKAVINDAKLVGRTDAGKLFELKKTVRHSPSLGAKPPEGALVLFDGKDSSEWNRGRVDKITGFLNTDGGDIATKKKFNNYTMHVEFLLPYRPDARGQGRGNSGFYQVNHYEVQILDSFGLDGKNNECGGVYTLLEPKVNMCLPPLVWQTYDADFTNAIRDESGKIVQKSKLTLKHNGVVIHDNAELKNPTGGARSEPEGTPGPILLQGHGNPLQFRNLWIVEKK
jgi:hypothetical protein